VVYPKNVHIFENRCCKKYMVQALVCRMEGDTVHVPHRKQETDFHNICINKFFSVNQNNKLSCENNTCQNEIIFIGQKSDLKQPFVVLNETVTSK
jgi:hypothetical protein